MKEKNEVLGTANSKIDSLKDEIHKLNNIIKEKNQEIQTTSGKLERVELKNGENSNLRDEINEKSQKIKKGILSQPYHYHYFLFFS